MIFLRYCAIITLCIISKECNIKTCDVELDVIVRARLFSFLMSNRGYAIRKGYLQREMVGFTRLADGSAVPEYRYTVTELALAELGKLFIDGVPERLKKHMRTRL